MSAETVALLRERLTALTPLAVDIEDDSHRHAGHVGARGGGGHYRLRIVSAAFAGLNTVARHRLVFATAGDLIPGRIHALVVQALTPEQA